MWLWAGSGAFSVPAPKTRERSIVDGWLMQWPTIGHCSVASAGRKPMGVITNSVGMFPGRGSAVPSEPTSQSVLEPTGFPSSTGVRQKKGL